MCLIDQPSLLKCLVILIFAILEPSYKICHIEPKLGPEEKFILSQLGFMHVTVEKGIQSCRILGIRGNVSFEIRETGTSS